MFQRKDFFEQVADSLVNNPLLRVVLIIREDYLAQLDPFKELLPERLRPNFRLERLKYKEAITAIRGPISYAIKDWSEEEVTDIREETNGLVKDLAKTLIELPNGDLREDDGEL